MASKIESLQDILLAYELKLSEYKLECNRLRCNIEYSTKFKVTKENEFEISIEDQLRNAQCMKTPKTGIMQLWPLKIKM